MIIGAAQTGELTGHLRQQLQGWSATTRTHAGDASAGEIKAVADCRQRGCEQFGMATEAEPGQIGRFVTKLQFRSGSSEQGHGQCRNPLRRKAIGNALRTAVRVQCVR